ncbi:hypothetical protein BSKO_11243 [Bryopsis sp. KO-2023]|nr:hypothetical protein BSKO_11243 [Bryopsis sp. KO-2023]
MNHILWVRWSTRQHSCPSTTLAQTSFDSAAIQDCHGPDKNGPSLGEDILKAESDVYRMAMGEWSVGDSCPELRRTNVMRGSLSPERLQQYHRLSEKDAYHLYKLIYTHSFHFHKIVHGLCEGARHRNELVRTVWKTYAMLWTEALNTFFDSEVISLSQRWEEAIQREQTMQARLRQLELENKNLESHANGLLKSKLECLLLKKTMSEDLAGAQGKIVSLSLSNENLAEKNSTLVQGNEIVQTELDEALRLLQEARDQLAQMHMLSSDQRIVFADKDQMIKNLSQALKKLKIESSEIQSKNQECFLKQRKAEEHAEQLSITLAATSDELAEKKKAYDLVVGDVECKQEEVHVLEGKTVDLERRICELQSENGALQNSLESERNEQNLWKQRLENLSMYLEDLEGVNQRQRKRKDELVHAYWPVVSKSKEVELQNEALKEQVEKFRDLAKKQQETQERVDELEALNAKLNNKILKTRSVPAQWDVPEEIDPKVMCGLLREKNRNITQQLAGLLEVQGNTLKKVEELELKALRLEGQVRKSRRENTNGDKDGEASGAEDTEQIMRLKYQIEQLERAGEQDLAWASAANARVLEFCVAAHDFLSEDDTRPKKGPIPVPCITYGSLAREMGQSNECRMTLVFLDHLWDQIETHGGRLMEWSAGARTKREDVIVKSERFKARLDRITDEHKKMKHRTANADQIREDLEKEVEGMKTLVEQQKEEITQANAVVTPLVEKNQGLSTRNEVLGAKLEKFSKENDMLKERASIMESDFWKVKATVIDLEVRNAKLAGEGTLTRAEKTQLENEVKTLKPQLMAAETQVSKLHKDLIVERARLRRLGEK